MAKDYKSGVKGYDEGAVLAAYKRLRKQMIDRGIEPENVPAGMVAMEKRVKEED